MVKLSNINFYYEKENIVLDNLQLSIEKSNKIAVLGENGAGKSTLFKLLNGLLKPISGEILIDGNPIKYDKKSLFNLRKKVGIVFQDPDTQIFAPDVFGELAYGLKNIGLNDQEIISKIDEVAKLCKIEHLLDKPTHHLSYGQKKIISIASILVMEPEIFIFDEPTIWLDPKMKKRVINIMDKLYKNGKTIILSTHNVDFAYSFVDMVYIIKDGKVLDMGTPNLIFNKKEVLKMANLDQPIAIKLINQLNIKNNLNINLSDLNIEGVTNG